MSTSTVQRAPNGRLLPGHANLNPKGRPRTGYALAEAIRKVADPVKMAEIAWDIALGKGMPLGEAAGGGWAPIVKPETRLAALNWLSSNGYIKPPTEINTSGAGPARAIDFGRLPAEDLAVFERLLQKATAEDEG